MNGKQVFMHIVSGIMLVAVMASLFFDGRTRAYILIGVLLAAFVAYHIMAFLLIHEMGKDKSITLYIKSQSHVKGKWIKSNIAGEEYVCSNCGGACWHYDYRATVKKSYYCPNCGAKMDVQEDEHEHTD